MNRAARTLVAISAVSSLLVPPAAYAETVSSKVNASNTTIYTFIPDEHGTVTITAMADKSSTFVMVVLDSDDINWCSGVSEQQLVRCDFTVVAGQIVAIGMLTVSGKIKVTLNVTGPLDEFVFRTSAEQASRVHAATTKLQEIAAR